MNWDQIKGDWHQLSRRLKEKWKKLTDADLKSISGSRDELEGVLQERYGYNEHQAAMELDRFTNGLTS